MAVKRRFDLLPSLASESFVERPFERVANLTTKNGRSLGHLTRVHSINLIQRSQGRMNQ